MNTSSKLQSNAPARVQNIFCHRKQTDSQKDWHKLSGKPALICLICLVKIAPTTIRLKNHTPHTHKHTHTTTCAHVCGYILIPHSSVEQKKRLKYCRLWIYYSLIMFPSFIGKKRKKFLGGEENVYVFCTSESECIYNSKMEFHLAKFQKPEKVACFGTVWSLSVATRKNNWYKIVWMNKTDVKLQMSPANEFVSLQDTMLYACSSTAGWWGHLSQVVLFS